MLELKTTGQLNAFLAGIRFSIQKPYFNVRRNNGKIEEFQSDNYKTAMAKMQEKFANECEENGIANNHMDEEYVDLLVVICRDDDDEAIVACYPYCVDYTGYHGDYSEHFNQRSFV